MRYEAGMVVARWNRWCLIVAAFLTGTSVLLYLLGPLPQSTGSVVLQILPPVFVVWSPVISLYFGLRAISSICASICSMGYFGLGLFSAFTPGINKMFSLISILLAVFYYFASTTTWKAHEVFWLSKTQQITETSG